MHNQTNSTPKLGTWDAPETYVGKYKFNSMQTNPDNDVSASLWGTQGGNYVYTSGTGVNPNSYKSQYYFVVDPNTGATVKSGTFYDSGRGINDVFGNEPGSAAYAFVGRPSYGASFYSSGQQAGNAQDVANASGGPVTYTQTPQVQGTNNMATADQEAAARALLAKGNTLGQQASAQTGVAFTPSPIGQQQIQQPAQNTGVTYGPSTVTTNQQQNPQLGTNAYSQQLAQQAQALGVPNVPQSLLQGGSQPPQATGQQAYQAAATGALVPGAIQPTGSIVDTLKMAGMDSSFAARQQLAQQYGIQGYTGTAAQNTSLEKKFVDAFNASKGSAVPSGPAEARSMVQTTLEEQGTAIDPLQSFFSNYGNLDPITASLFDQIAQIDSNIANRPTYTQLVKDELAKSGVADLKEDLAQVIADVRLTEDQVREELSGGGGLVLESQVRGVAAARTKVLLTKAEQLSNIISAKEEAVDRIIQMTSLDRQEVDAQLDRKLGVTKMLADYSMQMQDRARENARYLVSEIGYDGLVDSISSQQELNSVARSLGVSPQTLLQLSTVKTTSQRKMELEQMSYQLSVDKFNEDKRQFGLQYALESQKQASQYAAQNIVSPYQTERTTRNIDSINSLIPKVSAKTVGLGSYGAYIPGTAARNFDAEVAALKANVAFSELTAMREASKTGGALGAISDRELQLLQSSLGALDTGQSPANFIKSLNTVKDNIYRWNAQALSVGNGYDYEGLKKEGYSDEEIYNYFK